MTTINSPKRLFPFLFGGAFIEAKRYVTFIALQLIFPFLFGGAFIEAAEKLDNVRKIMKISLPFRRGFH